MDNEVGLDKATQTNTDKEQPSVQNSADDATTQPQAASVEAVAPPAAPPDTSSGTTPATYTLRQYTTHVPPLRLKATDKMILNLFKRINRTRPWYKLPTWLAVVNFVALRDELRSQNLHDTNVLPMIETKSPAAANPVIPPPSDYSYRTLGGEDNDLADLWMGEEKTRFGRNFPLQDSYPDKEPLILQPSPRLISQTLFRRDKFVPATTLNLLAAAWIQFQTHDWFNHGDAGYEGAWQLPLDENDPWYERTMRIPRTPADVTRVPGTDDGPPTFLNRVSHWWDASAIYGTEPEVIAQLRSYEDGKMMVVNNMLRLNPLGVPMTGFNENWWVGLTFLHTLFTLEHNSICDRLKRVYPSWTDEMLFQKARLINAALLAKIHTVEWTPGILAHPALQIGMRANWWGIAGERLYNLFGRFARSEVINGIMGSPTDHHGAPFALTEEFTSVYRLHPLLPDELTFRNALTGADIKQVQFIEMADANAAKLFDQGIGLADVGYTFGTSHPGAIQLHNYPRFLQDLTRPNGQRLDVGAVDILRDRERGVPRYNRFRELVHKPRLSTFEELTTNPQWAKEIAEVYDGNIDRVDLMVGLFAEPTPPGFGFSDTAFRIFILMASRRLKSDRFFTRDYRPEVYTPEGIAWIDANNMRTVIARHFPQLQPYLSRVNNAFAPWPH